MKKVIAFSVGVCGLLGWSLWSRDRYKQAFHEAMIDNSELEDRVEIVHANNEYIKDRVIALHKKPVCALITDSQINQIGQVVAQALKEPKWLN